MVITIGDIIRLCNYVKSIAEVIPMTDITKEWPIAEQVYNENTLIKFKANLAALTDEQCKQLSDAIRSLQYIARDMEKIRAM